MALALLSLFFLLIVSGIATIQMEGMEALKEDGISPVTVESAYCAERIIWVEI
jgi:hypothetical protein